VRSRKRSDTLSGFVSGCRAVAFALFAAIFLVTSRADARDGAAQSREILREDVRTILAFVAAAMNVRLDPAEPLPVVRLASTTTLARFREAMAPQWGFRPHVIINAYAVASNEIYLDDSSDYYRRTHRTLDDSLAHELAHYVQVRYRGESLEDESCELEAVIVQTAYRQQISRVAGPTALRTGKTRG
jgi:hypothetical protein